MTRPLRLLCIVMFTVLAIAPSAGARPIRVALTQLEDDPTGVGKRIAGALEDSELEIVPNKRMSRAVARLGPGAALDAENLTKLAAELDVDAIVQCELDRRTRRLRVAIFADGKWAKRFSVIARDTESEKFRKAVRSAMLSRIAAVVATGDAAEHPTKPRKARKADAANDEPIDPPAPAKRKARTGAPAVDGDDDGDAARPLPAAVPGDDDPPGAAARAATPRIAARDDDGDVAAELGAERVAKTARAGRGPTLPAIRFDAGASAIGRRLAFKTTGGTGAPPDYRNTPVPGARAAGEIYPFAFDAPSGWLSGLGAAVEYDQALAISLNANGATTAPLAITERSYAVGLRYRLAFGQRSTSPTLTFGAGYATRTFKVDRSALMSTASIDLPDVDYRMIDPGLSFRLPLGGRVAVTLAGRGLLVMSAGAIQDADQYGMARVYGASAAAGFEIGLTDRLGLRLAAEGTQIGSTFAGTGILTNSRDGDSSTIEVRGVIDRYYGGSATLSVIY